jgi:nucleoside-diphosphate-sugar epimerase
LKTQRIQPKRVIYLSSLAAAGPSRPGQPVKESDPPSPVSPYGRSKLQGEVESLKFAGEFPLLVIRVGPVFGPRDRDFLSYFKFLKMGILPSFGSGSSLMSVCYVQDLVRAMRLCQSAEPATGEIINIADPTPITWDDFGRTAAQFLGKSPKQIKIPLALVYTIAFFSEFIDKFKKKPGIISLDKIGEMRQNAWVADTHKAEKMLDFRTDHSLAAGLEVTLQWYTDHNWL